MDVVLMTPQRTLGPYHGPASQRDRIASSTDDAFGPGELAHKSQASEAVTQHICDNNTIRISGNRHLTKTGHGR